MSADADQQTTHFGFADIPLDEKQDRVDAVFHKVAERYDLMNDLMSVGLHRLWKDRLVTAVNPPKNKYFKHLDVAGGTGDVAFRIAEASRLATVTIADINPDMLQVGRARAAKRGYAERLSFVEANAEDLPFAEASYDAYTIAFGIRNVPRIEKALLEARRVLKRGGRFLCLEFSHVDLPGLAQIYDAYSFNLIPPIGKMVTGESAPYRYLVESIRTFPAAERFRDMVAEAGFQRASFERLSGGIVAIHSGWKL